MKTRLAMLAALAHVACADNPAPISPDGGEADAAAVDSAAEDPRWFARRYVLVRRDLRTDLQVTAVETIIDDAADAGYNGIVLGADGVQYLRHPYDDDYVARVGRVVRKARDRGMALIPYSFGSRDPTTRLGAAFEDEVAEALPVRATRFVVDDTGTIATPPAREVELAAPNPSFDQVDEMGRPIAWDLVRGVASDPSVHRTGPRSVVLRRDPDSPAQSWLMRTIDVTRFRGHALSVWSRGEPLANIDLRVYGRVGTSCTRELYRRRDRIPAPTEVDVQGWRRHEIFFDSLGHASICLWLGATNLEDSDAIWFDDASVHEVGLEHAALRPSLPIGVVGVDQPTHYQQGVHWELAPEPGRIEILGAAIPPGTALDVSWYLRGDVDAAHPPASACQPATFAEHAGISSAVYALFQAPGGFMIDYEEWRVGFWDPACTALGLTTAGDYLAYALARARTTLHEIDPALDLYVWSDMFSEVENARDAYWMVNAGHDAPDGTLRGSWAGLSPELTVMTWADDDATVSRMAEQLAFFTDRDQPQMIAGYYDRLDNVTAWLDALESVEATGDAGVDGFIYATWDRANGVSGDYDELDEVAALIRMRGRWP